MIEMVSTQDVLKIFGISKELLRRMMRATPDDFEPKPWVNLGTVNRPVHRWHTGPVLLEWAAKTSTWRQSPVTKSTQVVLPQVATRTEPSPPARATTRQPRRRRVEGRGVLKSSSRSPLMRYAIKEKNKS